MSSCCDAVGITTAPESDLKELLRDVLMLRKDSTRPHKQLVRRGFVVYSTGNVAGILPSAGKPVSLLEEVECATRLGMEHDVHDNHSVFDAAGEKTLTQAKLFFSCRGIAESQDVCDAVSGLCCELRISSLDMLILSMHTFNNDILALFELWQRADNLRRQGQVLLLGCADIDATQLKLMLSAGMVPDVVEVLHDGPSPPKTELLELCRERGISVVTHGDRDTSMCNCSQRFGQTFSRRLTSDGGFARVNFVPSRILRYHRIVENRSVVIAKGYSIKAKYVIA